MSTVVDGTGGDVPRRTGWRSVFARNSTNDDALSEDVSEDKSPTATWSMGILNDRETNEVPGSVLLLTGHRNEPLGLRNAPARTSASSLPTSQYPKSQASRRPSSTWESKKKTADGAMILEPQPEDSRNDPLNWPVWRRDCALLSLGLYCMVGGGMTPILAAGFTNVAKTYDVTVPRVALTTGLYMMGLGIGSVFASPTAILYGKRPVYLAGAILFIVTSVWCALSPSYVSLLIARIFQGIAVSPVECLPSATIAEIFFLHERAYRIGIYTLLLLGGKNLVPLVSAAIIQTLDWRWVFWIVALVVGFCFVLLFLFVPETFWDRTPRPKSQSRRSTGMILSRMFSSISHRGNLSKQGDAADDENLHRRATSRSSRSEEVGAGRRRSSTRPTRPTRPMHVGFAPDDDDEHQFGHKVGNTSSETDQVAAVPTPPVHQPTPDLRVSSNSSDVSQRPLGSHKFENSIQPKGEGPPTPVLHEHNSPYYVALERSDLKYLNRDFPLFEKTVSSELPVGTPMGKPSQTMAADTENLSTNGSPLTGPSHTNPSAYTHFLRGAPPRSFAQQLAPWNGRLTHDRWIRVAARPFFLFAYPAVLWSSIVYSCSIGWLIVLSESVSVIYRSPTTYNFSALSTGLIYLSPFIGGILGTAVAGKLSDIIVRAMSRRNGGLYEPEFRLVMAAPVALATVIGLMGFGWSAAERDAWIVPTLFFGIISFGCSLGSTTAITFCVDSYRQYAGEALVTLNFSKNIFHGLVFSLFFNTWLQEDGSRKVFVALGGIQLALMLLTVPMYIYGKRARMWTVRRNFMEKF